MTPRLRFRAGEAAAPRLSPRHLKVVIGVLRGHSRKVIAQEERLTLKTVDAYLREIAAALPPACYPGVPAMRRIALSYELVAVQAAAELAAVPPAS